MRNPPVATNAIMAAVKARFLDTHPRALSQYRMETDLGPEMRDGGGLDLAEAGRMLCAAKVLLILLAIISKWRSMASATSKEYRLTSLGMEESCHHTLAGSI